MYSKGLDFSRLKDEKKNDSVEEAAFGFNTKGRDGRKHKGTPIVRRKGTEVLFQKLIKTRQGKYLLVKAHYRRQRESTQEALEREGKERTEKLESAASS